MEVKLPQAGQLRYSDREIMDEIGRTIFCSLADKRMILSSYNSYSLDDRMIFEEEGEEGERGAEKMDDSERSDTESSFSFLTKRQLEVLQMRHQGLSQQDVADRLGLPAPISAFWRRGLTRTSPGRRGPFSSG